MVVLWGEAFSYERGSPLSEVPLDPESLGEARLGGRPQDYRATSLTRNTHPHRITMGP